MLAITAALGLLAAMVLVVISGSTASAEVTVWTPGGPCGSLQSTVVPPDVHSMSVEVRGGRGGRGGNENSGEKGDPGDGSVVTATFAVTPGSVVSARVGCPGIDGGDFDNSATVPGWSSGGGSGRGWSFKPVTGGSGGSGGGSSAVCIGGACSPGAGTEIVVAAGGGGGGISSCAGTSAGRGGAAGLEAFTANGSGSGPSGANGSNGGNTGANDGGGAGGAGGVNSTGGSPDGGTAPSEDGGFGATTVVGGGGGGGYVGGKQGGNSQPLCRGGGGGGGGSSWIKSTATDVITGTHAGAAGVTVTFASPIVTTTSTSTSTTTTSSTSSTTTTTTTPPSNLGTIRAESVPPVRTQIKIDGNIANSWGLDWVKVAQGIHALCFSDVPGYTTPPCTVVNVAIGSTNLRTAEFVQRGYLQVTTSPAVASRISVDGEPRDNWGLFADFEPGSHQVCFGAVAGYTPPPCQTVNVTAGATTPVTGTFTPSAGVGLSNVGLLRVTTSPALPSQIVVDDIPMDRYGLDWVELAPGPHTVCFTHVEGYTEPGCQFVDVTAGATTSVVGTFSQRGFLRVFTSPALPGTITINGLPANDWGVYTDLPVGTYQICWGYVPGHFIPACQSATITAGNTTTITGTYG